MFTKAHVVFLATAILAKDALALNAHRHGHQHLHKKDVAYMETDYTTVTHWTTVTVYDDDETTAAPTQSFYKGNSRSEHYAPAATSSSLSSSSEAPSSSVAAVSVPPVAAPVETQAPAPAPAPVPTVQAEVVVPPAATFQAAPPAPSGASTGSTGTTVGAASSGKRGLAYNDGSLLSRFVGSKAAWTYNWGQTPDGADPTGLEFVPMMWGPQHLNGWSNNAEKAIAKGSKAFLSFNECDMASQANMDPYTAAQKHIEIMGPYANRVRISTPSITNSQDPNQGVGWLSKFLQACGGQCAYDFCAVHWYDQAQPSIFLNHLLKAHEVCGKNIWVTEFAPFGSDDQINDFVKEVMYQMDNNATFSFVERYAYFMVSQGSLVSGSSLSSYGQSFGFA